MLGYEANTRGIKKIASDGAGWGGPASRVHGNQDYLEVNGDFFFIAHPVIFLARGQGACHGTLHGILHELGFLSTAAAAAADHR